MKPGQRWQNSDYRHEHLPLHPTFQLIESRQFALQCEGVQ